MKRKQETRLAKRLKENTPEEETRLANLLEEGKIEEAEALMTTADKKWLSKVREAEKIGLANLKPGSKLYQFMKAQYRKVRDQKNTEARLAKLLELIEDAKRRAYGDTDRDYSVWLCRGRDRFRIVPSDWAPKESDQVVWIEECGRDPDPCSEIAHSEDRDGVLVFIDPDGDVLTFDELLEEAISQEMESFDIEAHFTVAQLADHLSDPMCDPDPE